MYFIDLLKYKRNITPDVNIGYIAVGGNNAVRVQSMTNTKTSDVLSTAQQAISIYEAGAEFVRITAPTVRDAELLYDIKNEIKARGYNIPLVADIHFSPKAAETAAATVEKVRINPGNYTDKKRISNTEYTEEEYLQELAKIRNNLTPLLNACKLHGTAIRIGTNHGSLSDRILHKYGDTPLGMVESTMEFLRLCVEQNFSNVLISMKASNPLVMIHATRLLVKSMYNENMNFPIHLGVTEAGNDDEGRVKSAIGISALLADGIGDTLRVSLTEKPENEIPVAKLLAELKFDTSKIENVDYESEKIGFYEYKKRETFPVKNIGGNNPGIVIADFINAEFDKSTNFFEGKLKPDYIYTTHKTANNRYSILCATLEDDKNQDYPFFTYKEYLNSGNKNSDLNFVEIDYNFFSYFPSAVNFYDTKVVFVLKINNELSAIHQSRKLFYQLIKNDIKNPVIIQKQSSFIGDKFLVDSATSSGPLFIDGLGNGILIEGRGESVDRKINTSFAILQACRVRISKTEYISCPSCGRTLFDLEATTAKIKSATAHLVGLKIGIMGCIVNGPGEMADADYGYVGAGRGKVNLYKGKEVVKRNIDESRAVDELLLLIEKDI